ncbi:LTA synthase family protein [Clostridium algidicarnis]|uniref:LTA synthase family protein n=2 Tax=Clostridium algidicarnis TaxID=37659 RepID=UPI001C0E5DDD|nr:LTA synthase family protein [Clostridium algidicarnis]MBU3202566.1 LTA synthase family protein [Clostridium algidicarnis]MBU3206964.1 LTA synthase family protein [Clostridium algidicarnis]MBU3210720.1 LTA synthase family protein [Clostridium algidicarnis]MBU3222772.1 LTA synthase family protein [Clostridium algidicarnis]
MVDMLNKTPTSHNKGSVHRGILFFITLFSITFKCILFLSFINNKNTYSFNLALGFKSSIYFLNYYLAFIMLFMSFYFLFKNKGHIKYLISINSILTLFILVDLWYFRGFNTVPSLTIIKQTANLDNLSGSVFSMLSKYDLLFVLDLIILSLWTLKHKNIYIGGKRHLGLFFGTIIVTLSFIFYVPFSTEILKKDNDKSYLFSMYDATDTTTYFSPIGYHIFNAYSVWQNSKTLELTTEEKSEIDKWYKDKFEDIPDNQYQGLFKDKNLILIQVESLENFVINEKVEDKEITPNLNKLLANSIYFPNINEQVNEGTSSDSDLMTNTSIYPLRQGSTFFNYPNNTYNSLPLLLEEMGYETLAIHPDKGAFWNWMEGLKGVGFKKCIDSHDFEIDEVIGLGLSDASYFRQIVPILKKQNQPFYSFMVTLTSHGPFDLPKEYKELNLSEDLNNNVLGGYFESVHYTDKQIGLFLQNLEAEGLLNNTVVAITGDHTGVHKYYNDQVQKLESPDPKWLNVDNHIPFIIYDKSFEEPQKLEVTGGQIDLMPTLAYLMGINEISYNSTVMGRNLLKTEKDYSILTNKDFVGTSVDMKEHSIKALEISDKIIKSNYFEKDDNN